MRKIINFILITFFVLLIVVITIPFIADMQFNVAQTLETDYRWKKAEEKYELAMKANPFNSKYPAEFADFLTHQSFYKKSKVLWLKRSENLYECALRLNPRCAEYDLKLGEIQLAYGSNNKHLIDKAFYYFNKALQDDPNGFNISYSVGYEGMNLWDILNSEQKEIILARLRYSLVLRPKYYEYACALVWQKTKDFNLLRIITPDNLESNRNLYLFILQIKELCKFRKEQMEIVNFYWQKEKPAEYETHRNEKKENIDNMKQKASRESQVTDTVSYENWRGLSKDGKKIYRNGDIYWTGTINGLLFLPKGEGIINIQAKGSPANDVFPYMLVELDGKEIGETFIDSFEWKEYRFRVNTDGGIKILNITFTNDGGNAERKEDRNLYIGKAQVVSR